MSSSIELPSLQTNFSQYSSRSYRPASPSPSSPSPVMSFQSRSNSIPSLSSRLSTSSLHSQYSSASDRSMSPGPATPCDMMSRSPSFSHERPYKSMMTAPQKHSMPPSFSPVQQHQQPRFSSSSHHHHPYQQSAPHHHHHYGHHHVSIPHPATVSKQYHSQAMPSPRDIYPSSPRDHAEYPLHRETHHSRGDRSPYGGPGDYFSRAPTASSYHHLATPTTPSIMESTSARIHPHSPVPSAAFVAHQASTRSIHSSPYYSPPASSRHGRMEDDSDSPLMSRSPSVSSVRSYFSRESSPYPSEQSYGPSHHHGGLASPASTSMTSLSASLSSNNSSSVSLAAPSSSPPIPPSTPLTATSPQLLLCPVCSRPFKPSKNQNCNLRRHLKNVHNMSPTMHPRKCKWDSLPDGRVKDDKDRKERTRKSKRLWARKFRLRRKVEEAAMVLSMLSQAM